MATYYVNAGTGSDSNVGSSGSPWLTIAHGLATIANGDILGLQAGTTYSEGTGLTFSTGSFGNGCRLIGCTTTVGDGGMPTITATAAITLFTISAGGSSTVENCILDGGGTGTTAVSTTAGYANGVIGCKVENWTGDGLDLGGNFSTAIANEVTTCNTAGGTAAIYATSAGSVVGNNIHGNSSVGISQGAGEAVFIASNRIWGNTGAGIAVIYPMTIMGNTIHDNGSDGISSPSFGIILTCYNNILTNNGGYGLNVSNSSLASPACDYNWFGSGSLANVSGPRNGIAAGAHDLSGDPQYTSAATGDFTPQNAAVQAGFP